MGQLPHRISAPPDLGLVLQTTLDVYDLLKRFHQVLQTKISYHSFEFVHQGSNHALTLGTIAPYEALFSLNHNNESLGEIRFTKNSVFQDCERKIISEALTQLIYPLRNALSYQAIVLHSVTCSLTGLGNRCAFDQTIQREISLGQRHRTPFALLLLDIDNFKQINDCYGHLSGDAVLREMGKLIKQQKRNSDQAFRYGGEEFAIILHQSTKIGAAHVAERIRQQIEHHDFMIQGTPVHMTVSMGLSQFEYRDTFETLFARVDSALYSAKINGKNQILQID